MDSTPGWLTDYF